MEKKNEMYTTTSICGHRRHRLCATAHCTLSLLLLYMNMIIVSMGGIEVWFFFNTLAHK